MKRVLVVVDMQNDFVTGALGSAEARAIAPALAQYAQAFDGEVVFTLDTHAQNYLDTQEGRRLPVAHCLRASEGWNLTAPLAPLLEGRRAFEKSAFGSVDLAQYLRQARAEEVVLAGVCTDVCVISNALLIKAFVPEARVCVEARLCAGATNEGHLRALEAMRACQIDIL